MKPGTPVVAVLPGTVVDPERTDSAAIVQVQPGVFVRLDGDGLILRCASA